MATCPKCYEALTDDHRCSGRIVSRAIQAISTAGAGATAGAVFCFVVNERPVGALVLAAATLGGVLAVAMRQAVRR